MVAIIAQSPEPGEKIAQMAMLPYIQIRRNYGIYIKAFLYTFILAVFLYILLSYKIFSFWSKH